MIHGKTYNKSPRRINHKATKSKTNLNSDLDTVNCKNINNPTARNTVINIKDENGYVDVWRALNDTKRKFTWRRLIPDRKQARLVFLL